MSCQVCAELYEQTVRTPLVLPCGHTFCRPCLTDIRKSGSFHCPKCRMGHKNLQVEALTVNYSLLNILPLCNQFECDKCATHGDDLRYWCANCDLPLCSICLYSGHPQGHTVKLAQTFVTEKKQTLVEKINVIFRNIESHKKGLKADFNVLDKRVKKLFYKNACLQDIEGALEDLLADVKNSNNITSVLYFEKSVGDFQAKEKNFSGGKEAQSGKTKDSEAVLRKTNSKDAKQAEGEHPEAAEAKAAEGAEACQQQQQQLHSEAKDEPAEESEELTDEEQELEEEESTEESEEPAEKSEKLTDEEQESEEEESEPPRAVMDYHDGRLLLHTLALPASTRLSLQVPREVFLELGVGDRCLGSVYIRLWCHLRRAQQLLALCMGTMGPSLLGAKASDKVRNIIEFRTAVDRDKQTVSHALLTGLEWGGQHAKPEAEGLVTGMTSYDRRVHESANGLCSYNTRGHGYVGRQLSNEDMAFGICTQEHPGMNVNAAFGEVVAGLEVAKEAFQHNPVSEVTITSCGLVLPGLSQQG